MEYHNDMEGLLQIKEDLARIPPDIRRAQFHKKAFQFYKSPFTDSEKCPCCDFYVGHLKYTFCADLQVTSDCNGPMFYLYLIKWMVFQLSFIHIAFRVFFIISFIKTTTTGTYCENHPNCDPESKKIESIWNYAPNYGSLTFGDNNSLDVLFTFTFFILIAANYYWLRKHNVVGLQVLILKLGFQILKNRGSNKYPASILTPNVLKVLQIQSGNYYINISYDFEQYENILFQKSKQFYLRERDPIKRKQKLIRRIFYDQILISKCVKQITLIFFNQYAQQDFFKVCPQFQEEDIRQGNTLKGIGRFFSANLIAVIISYLIMIIVRALSLLNKQAIAYLEEEEYDKNYIYVPKISLMIIQFGTFWLFGKIAQKLIYRRYFFFYNFYLIVVLVLLPFGQGSWNDIFQIHVTSTQYLMLENDGPLDNIETASKFIYIAPLLMWVFQIKNLWGLIKFCYKRCFKFKNYCQIEANLLYEKEEVDIFEKRMTIYKYYVFALVYYIYYPNIIIYTITGLIVIYIVDKLTIVSDSSPIKRDILDDYVTALQSFSVPLFALLAQYQILLFYKPIDIATGTIGVIFLIGLSYKILKQNTFKISEKLSEENLRRILSTQLETLSYDQGFDPQNGMYLIPNKQKLKLFEKVEKRLKKCFNSKHVEQDSRVNVSDSDNN